MAAEQPTAVVTGPAQWPKAAVLAACAAAGTPATSTAGDGELVLEVGGNSHEGLKAALAACAGAAPAGSDAQKVRISAAQLPAPTPRELHCHTHILTPCRFPSSLTLLRAS